MKMKLLTCFFFIMCCQSHVIWSHEMFTTKQGGHGNLGHSLQEQQRQGVSEMIGSNGEGEGRSTGGANELLQVNHLQKGKGVYGGADLGRHRPKTSNGSSSLQKISSSLISSIFVQISINSLLVILFFF